MYYVVISCISYFNDASRKTKRTVHTARNIATRHRWELRSNSSYVSLRSRLMSQVWDDQSFPRGIPFDESEFNIELQPVGKPELRWST